MRLNENVKIIGHRVILVPYEAKFVPKYHNWMQNVELQELTASTPLTLEQEYDMQKSWRDDVDKLTFLILCKDTYDNYTGVNDREIAALVGDTNLFFRIEHGDNENDNVSQMVAEAEIMIAESNVRRRGYGTEAMLLMFKYALTHIPVKKFEVKVGMDNRKSLNMFEKFHFKETSTCDIFKEVTLCCDPTCADWLDWLCSQISPIYEPYHG